MKQIVLTKGKVALVDDCDFEWINSWKWYASTTSTTESFYATRKSRASEIGGSGHPVYMHRVICHAPIGFEVDHIDGNPLNNCRSNLRLATKAQNQMNRGKIKSSSSGFKGVCWCNFTKRWTARIAGNGNDIHIGRYDDPRDAAIAYDETAKRLHGEFALLNFP